MPERDTLAAMFIVAVTRWGPGLDEQLPALAEQLGLFPYDLRMRLAGPLPVIVARVAEREAASALMAKLREWGHGSVGCEASKVIAGDAMLQVREFRFEDERLIVEGQGQVHGEVAAAEVLMLVHAMAVSEQHHTQETSKQQFSAARAVLSGGLVMSRTTTTVSHANDSDSEERIYLFRRSFADPLLFRQHQLRYAGLGAAMSRSSHDNFAELTRRLRAFAPEARYDDRLRTSRRKLDFEAASHDQAGKTKTSTLTSSNASGLDLAAHLLLVGLARGQL
ncbi:hypothetical protein ACNOYE_21560 [Nannocystaceae bacterium ST9]